MELKVINPPLQISIDEYHEQLNIYVDKVKQVPGIRTVLTMGSVNAPGLSDLDVICVVDDNFKPIFASKLSTADMRQDIFIHGPVVIHKKFLHDLQYIIWASSINYVWGERELPRTFNQYSIDEQVGLATAYLVDFSESRLLQCAYSKHKRVFDKRGWMARLWSLTHTKKLCDFVEINLSSQALNIIEDIKKSRSDWLQKKLWKDTELIELLYQSKKVYQEVILKVLSRNYTLDPTHQQKLVFQEGNKQVVCLQDTNNLDAIYSEIKIGSKFRSYWRIIAPNLYAAHLANYGFRDQQAVKHRKKGNNILKKRAKLIFQSNNFVRENCCGVSIMTGYMGLSILEKKSFKDKLMGRFDKLYWAYQEKIG